MENEPAPAPKPKRTRKPSAPRKPRQKDPGILAIEKEANDKKEQYRLAQKSGGVLIRILKLTERLTPADRQKLFDELSKTETPSLLPRPVVHADSSGMAG